MLLRPSSANLWVNCPGFAKLAEICPPDEPSDPAREGTCAAWVAEMVLRGVVKSCADMIGEQHENGWIVDRSMARHIQGYVDTLLGYGGTIHAERRVVLVPGVIEGTPDAFGVDTAGVLIIDDLKYGFEIVEPQTWQISVYASAILQSLMSDGVVINQVRLGIYQPRAYHPSGIHRSWTITVDELMARRSVILSAAEKAQDPNAMCIAGSWCRRCDAAAKCGAVSHEVYRCVSTMHNAQRRDMTVTEMAEELAFLDLAEALMKGRRDAVTAEADARMNRGENIPGWHREQGYGQRRWNVSADMVRMLTGIDPTEGKMVTPAELERMGANPEVVKSLVVTPRLKAKLKPVPDGYYAAQFGGTK